MGIYPRSEVCAGSLAAEAPKGGFLCNGSRTRTDDIHSSHRLTKLLDVASSGGPSTLSPALSLYACQLGCGQGSFTADNKADRTYHAAAIRGCGG